MLIGHSLIGLMIFVIAVVVPLWMILPRAGMPSWLALFAVIPLALVILLWVMAFKRWPGDNAEIGA